MNQNLHGFVFNKISLIYLFLTVLGLHCCTGLFSSHGEGCSPVAIHGFLITRLLLVQSLGYREHVVFLQHVDSAVATPGIRAQAQ